MVQFWSPRSGVYACAFLQTHYGYHVTEGEYRFCDFQGK